MRVIAFTNNPDVVEKILRPASGPNLPETEFNIGLDIMPD